MNVLGLNADGEEHVIQPTNQNEEYIAISQKYLNAVKLGPSPELEEKLNAILKQVHEQGKAEYEKLLVFQCNREITKSKIKRGEYKDAIPHIINNLKIDQNRADIWMDLAKCAQETENSDLYRAAVTKVQKIRPQLQFDIPRPNLPSLSYQDYEPTFINIPLPDVCWRYFVMALMSAVTKEPDAILEISFQQTNSLDISQGKELQYNRPLHIKVMPAIQERKGKNITKLGGYSLLSFFHKQLNAEQRTGSTWDFNQPAHYLAANTLEKVSNLRFQEGMSPELAKLMIKLASINCVFDLLTAPTKLFLAETANFYEPSEAPRFLKDVMRPCLHPPNALLRIAFACLESAIRENRPCAELQRLYGACRSHLTEPLGIQYSGGRIINEELLITKKHQIDILRMILEDNPDRTPEQAKKLFANPTSLQFLSLSNIARLFMQYEPESVSEILPQFLKMLPKLVALTPKEAGILEPLFAKFTFPLPDECVESLVSLLMQLHESDCDKTIKFAVAVALGYASRDYEKRAEILIKAHKVLSDACHLRGGLFLELLLDALLASRQHSIEVQTQTQTNDKVAKYDKELKQAFSCYFSDVSLVSNTHESNLKLRCSRFLQPFYEYIHAHKDLQPFNQYLELWAHSKREGDTCLHDLDGYAIYRVLKKKESQVARATCLPPGYTSQMVFEDLLKQSGKSGDGNAVGLAKVLIRQYYTISSNLDWSAQPRREKLAEAAHTLENAATTTPWQKMIYGIVLAMDGQKERALATISSLDPFTDNDKHEARRLYWSLRLHQALGDVSNVGTLISEGMALSEKLTPEFAVPILTLCGTIKNDMELLQKAVSTCKKLRIPGPYLELARRQQPVEAYKTISYLVRAKCTNINTFYHFDLKMPFLMYAPEDMNDIKHDVLSIFVDSAAKSDNYENLYSLFSPSNKIDRKLSRVFKENRIIYGIDRSYIFIRYVEELTKHISSLQKPRAAMFERAVDALSKAVAINEQEINDAIAPLKDYLWKKQTGQDPPEGSTAHDLITIIDGGEDMEEDEEDEEDGEFQMEGEEEDGDVVNDHGEEEDEGDAEEEIVEDDDEDEEVDDDGAEEDDE